MSSVTRTRLDWVFLALTIGLVWFYLPVSGDWYVFGHSSGHAPARLVQLGLLSGAMVVSVAVAARFAIRGITTRHRLFWSGALVVAILGWLLSPAAARIMALLTWICS